MQPRRLLVLVPGLALGLLTVVHAQTIEPGLWEMKGNVHEPGKPDLSDRMARMREQMKNLPPQVRQQMEQRMAASGVALGDDGTVRRCISPEEAARLDLIRDGHQENRCTYTRVTRSGNVWRGALACTDPPGQGEFTTTLHGRRHYTTEGVVTSTDPSRPRRMEIRIDARFVSADCGALARRPAGKKR